MSFSENIFPIISSGVFTLGNQNQCNSSSEDSLDKSRTVSNVASVFCKILPKSSSAKPSTENVTTGSLILKDSSPYNISWKNDSHNDPFKGIPESIIQDLANAVEDASENEWKNLNSCCDKTILSSGAQSTALTGVQPTLHLDQTRISVLKSLLISESAGSKYPYKIILPKTMISKAISKPISTSCITSNRNIVPLKVIYSSSSYGSSGSLSSCTALHSRAEACCVLSSDKLSSMLLSERPGNMQPSDIAKDALSPEWFNSNYSNESFSVITQNKVSVMPISNRPSRELSPERLSGICSPCAPSSIQSMDVPTGIYLSDECNIIQSSVYPCGIQLPNRSSRECSPDPAVCIETFQPSYEKMPPPEEVDSIEEEEARAIASSLFIEPTTSESNEPSTDSPDMVELANLTSGGECDAFPLIISEDSLPTTISDPGDNEKINHLVDNCNDKLFANVINDVSTEQKQSKVIQANAEFNSSSDDDGAYEASDDPEYCPEEERSCSSSTSDNDDDYICSKKMKVVKNERQDLQRKIQAIQSRNIPILPATMRNSNKHINGMELSSVIPVTMKHSNKSIAGIELSTTLSVNSIKPISAVEISNIIPAARSSNDRKELPNITPVTSRNTTKSVGGMAFNYIPVNIMSSNRLVAGKVNSNVLPNTMRSCGKSVSEFSLSNALPVTISNSNTPVTEFTLSNTLPVTMGSLGRSEMEVDLPTIIPVTTRISNKSVAGFALCNSIPVTVRTSRKSVIGIEVSDNKAAVSPSSVPCSHQVLNLLNARSQPNTKIENRKLEGRSQDQQEQCLSMQDIITNLENILHLKRQLQCSGMSNKETDTLLASIEEKLRSFICQAKITTEIKCEKCEMRIISLIDLFNHKCSTKGTFKGDSFQVEQDWIENRSKASTTITGNKRLPMSVNLPVRTNGKTTTTSDYTLLLSATIGNPSPKIISRSTHTKVSHGRGYQMNNPVTLPLLNTQTVPMYLLAQPNCGKNGQIVLVSAKSAAPRKFKQTPNGEVKLVSRNDIHSLLPPVNHKPGVSNPILSPPQMCSQLPPMPQVCPQLIPITQIRQQLPTINAGTYVVSSVDSLKALHFIPTLRSVINSPVSHYCAQKQPIPITCITTKSSAFSPTNLMPLSTKLVSSLQTQPLMMTNRISSLPYSSPLVLNHVQPLVAPNKPCLFTNLPNGNLSTLNNLISHGDLSGRSNIMTQSYATTSCNLKAKVDSSTHVNISTLSVSSTCNSISTYVITSARDNLATVLSTRNLCYEGKRFYDTYVPADIPKSLHNYGTQHPNIAAKSRSETAQIGSSALNSLSLKRKPTSLYFLAQVPANKNIRDSSPLVPLTTSSLVRQAFTSAQSAHHAPITSILRPVNTVASTLILPKGNLKPVLQHFPITSVVPSASLSGLQVLNVNCPRVASSSSTLRSRKMDAVKLTSNINGVPTAMKIKIEEPDAIVTSRLRSTVTTSLDNDVLLELIGDAPHAKGSRISNDIKTNFTGCTTSKVISESFPAHLGSTPLLSLKSCTLESNNGTLTELNRTSALQNNYSINRIAYSPIMRSKSNISSPNISSSLPSHCSKFCGDKVRNNFDFPTGHFFNVNSLENLYCIVCKVDSSLCNGLPLLSPMLRSAPYIPISALPSVDHNIPLALSKNNNILSEKVTIPLKRRFPITVPLMNHNHRIITIASGHTQVTVTSTRNAQAAVFSSQTAKKTSATGEDAHLTIPLSSVNYFPKSSTPAKVGLSSIKSNLQFTSSSITNTIRPFIGSILPKMAIATPINSILDLTKNMPIIKIPERKRVSMIANPLPNSFPGAPCDMLNLRRKLTIANKSNINAKSNIFSTNNCNRLDETIANKHIPIQLGLTGKLFKMSSRKREMNTFLANRNDDKFTSALGFELCVKELRENYFNICKGDLSDDLDVTNISEYFAQFWNQKARLKLPRLCGINKLIEVIPSGDSKCDEDTNFCRKLWSVTSFIDATANQSFRNSKTEVTLNDMSSHCGKSSEVTVSRKRKRNEIADEIRMKNRKIMTLIEFSTPEMESEIDITGTGDSLTMNKSCAASDIMNKNANELCLNENYMVDKAIGDDCLRSFEEENCDEMDLSSGDDQEFDAGKLFPWELNPKVYINDYLY